MTKNFNEEVAGRNKLKISWVAFRGAAPAVEKEVLDLLGRLFPSEAFIISNREPDIILFMTGGSEREAISVADPGKPVLLLSNKGNNAYAAATEVMAWMRKNGRHALLSDAGEAAETGLTERWLQTVKLWQTLNERRAALIGTVSDWLVTTEPDNDRFKRLFGTVPEFIPWDLLPDYSHFEPDPALLRSFAAVSNGELADAARVLTLLRSVIRDKSLDAVAVECFSLVRSRKVTACLALAQLNAEGVTAACEGDLVSMAAMMILGTVTGRMPWMANTTGVSGDRILLSHCTAPLNMLTEIRLTTHYETGCSLAVRGNISASDVTLFRLSGSFEEAFITEGKITGYPEIKEACRTQLEIEIPQASSDLVRNHPLGNHLLLTPGKHADQLRMACSYKRIKVL